MRQINDGVPGLGPTDTLAQQRRAQDMQVAWDAYLGKLPDSLTPAPGQPDINVKSNRLGAVVDTGNFYLFGLPLGIEVDPKDPNLGGVGKARVKAAQAWLDGSWGDEDDRMTTLAKLEQNGAVFGQPYAKIVPPDAGSNSASSEQYPRVVVLNPQNMSVITDPDDCEVVTSYIIEYDATLPDGSTIRKRQTVARQRPEDREVLEVLDESDASASTSSSSSSSSGSGSDSDSDSDSGETTWLITNEARRGEGGEWRTVGQPQVWPHPWAPIADCQNLPISNQHWGLPDLTPDLIQLNRVLNFVLSNINAIGLSHGHPWIWASGADVSQITTGPGNIISLPEGGTLQALIANGDIAGLMAYVADLRSSMDEQSKVPGVATGRIAELPRGQMSGVSLRMLYQPLLFKTTFKRRLYGKLIRELCTRMLALGGFGDGTDKGGVKVLLHWKDPMPTDDLQEAQTALAWEQLGVSQDTLMQRGGFDPDVETAKVESQTQRKMQLQSQGLAPLGAGGLFPPLAASSAAPGAPGAPPVGAGASGPADHPPNAPPINHPAAIAARQSAQAAAGKPVTPDGKKPQQRGT